MRCGRRKCGVAGASARGRGNVAQAQVRPLQLTRTTIQIMNANDKQNLWQFDIIKYLSDEVLLIKNKSSGELMTYRKFGPDNFDILKKIKDIDNAHIMKIYDVVMDAQNCIAICEYVEGMTLEEYVGSQKGSASNEHAGDGQGSTPYEHAGDGSGSTLDTASAVNLMLQLLDGLKNLHALGIIHRDLTPTNIMVTGDGCIKIIDFDISREHKDGQVKDTQILGTVGDASPEQFGFSQTDASADIYACGVLLNFMLTGKLPDEQLPDGEIANVITKCTMIDKEKRYANVDELREALKSKHYSIPIEWLPLPGFRGETRRTKAISGILIALWALITINNFKILIQGFPYSEASELLKNIFRILSVSICYTAAPYFFLGDFAYLSRRVYPDNPTKGKRLFNIIGIASLILGFVFMRIFAVL